MKLEGIKVVDLSLFLPGPAMTQAMADHGAEVIKVEPVPAGEPNREIGPKREGVSVYFANTHRGKKSLALIAQMIPGFVDLAPTLFESNGRGRGCAAERTPCARVERCFATPRRAGPLSMTICATTSPPSA